MVGAKNQAEWLDEVMKVVRAARRSGVVDAINFWNILRFVGVPGQAYAWDNPGLFNRTCEHAEFHHELVRRLLEMGV